MVSTDTARSAALWTLFAALALEGFALYNMACHRARFQRRRTTDEAEEEEEEEEYPWCRQLVKDWKGESLIVELEASLFPGGTSFAVSTLKDRTLPSATTDPVSRPGSPLVGISFAGGGFKTIR